MWEERMVICILGELVLFFLVVYFFIMCVFFLIVIDIGVFLVKGLGCKSGCCLVGFYGVLCDFM